jgi:hypothetical protein
MFDLFKKDIAVRCQDTKQLGRLLHWLRSEGGLSQVARVEFPVTAVTGGVLGNYADKILYYQVHVPHYLYARLREKYLKEVVLSEAILQEEIFKEITQP